MDITPDTIQQLIYLTHEVYQNPDPQRQFIARQQLSSLSIAPQNFFTFIQILKHTNDIYLVQFTIQSLRRIIIKFSNHLPSSQLTDLGQTIISFIETNLPTGNLQYSTITTLSQLFGTLLRFFWSSAPDIRALVGSAAHMLSISPDHCNAACILLGELIEEISGHRANSIAASNSISAITLTRSVITPFGSNMIPSLILAATSALFQLLSQSLGYQQSQTYIESGHEWLKFPLTIPITFDFQSMTHMTTHTVVKNLLTLILKCIRFDFAGLGKSDDDEIIAFPTPSQWKPLTKNNFLLFMVISIAQLYSTDKSILELSLSLLNGILSFKQSAWANTIDRYVAGKYACVFVIMVLDSLSTSVGQGAEDLPRFIEEPTLFQGTTTLLQTIFRQFSLLDVINLFHPLIPCSIHFDQTLGAQYNQLNEQLKTYFSQRFKTLAQWASENNNVAPAVSQSRELDDISNKNAANPAMTQFGSPQQIHNDYTLFSQPQNPTRLFQQAMFNQWLWKIYDFTMKVYTIGFPPELLRSSMGPDGPHVGAADQLNISDMNPQHLVTSTADLGEISITDLMTIHQHLLSLWASFATAYNAATPYANLSTAANAPDGSGGNIAAATGNTVNHAQSVGSTQSGTATGTGTPNSQDDMIGSSSDDMLTGISTTWPRTSTYDTLKNRLQSRRLAQVGFGPFSITGGGLTKQQAIFEAREEDDVESQSRGPMGSSRGSISGSKSFNGTATGSNGQSHPEPLVPLQFHLDGVISRLCDFKHYHDILNSLPQILPQVSSSYIKAMIAAVGALYEGDCDLEEIIYCNIDQLSDLFFQSQFLQDQFATFTSIARSCPGAVASIVHDLYTVLKRSYIQQFTLLSPITQRLIYELNNGTYLLLNRAQQQEQQQQQQSQQQSGQSPPFNISQNPYFIYSQLFSTFFASAHQDNGVITLNNDEKAFLIQLHRTEAQISVLLTLITSMFQPKNNFFTSKSSKDQDLIVSTHAQCAAIVWEIFRCYTIRYGHYNVCSTPMQCQQLDITPGLMSNLSMETLISYLTITPGLSVQPLSSHHVQSKFGPSITQPFFAPSNPLFMIPPSKYLAHALLNGLGAIIDSLVYRQYLSRSHPYSVAPQGRSFSELIVSETFKTLGSIMLCFPHNSDIPQSGPPQTNMFGQQLDPPAPEHMQQWLHWQQNPRSQQVPPPKHTSLGLLFDDSGIPTFPEVLNIAVFFSIHALHVFPLKHILCIPIIELALSFLSHVVTTVNLAITLPSLPAHRVFIQHHPSITFTRVPTHLPFPTTFSFALECYDGTISSTPTIINTDTNNFNQQSTHQLVPQTAKTPKLIYTLPIAQSLTPQLQQFYQAVFPYAKNITGLTGRGQSFHTNPYTTVDLSTCLQVYYEITARMTKRSPTTLTTQFDALFGAIRVVLDKPSQQQDVDLFAQTIVFICTALTGAGGVTAGEHIYIWIYRFLPLLVRIGMQCTAIMYSEKPRLVNGRTNSNSKKSQQLTAGLQQLNINNGIHGQDAMSFALLSSFDDDDDDNGGGNEFMNAINRVLIHPTISLALSRILQFVSTCASQRGRIFPVHGVPEQSASLISSFFNSTEAIYSKDINTEPQNVDPAAHPDEPKPPRSKIPLPVHNEYYLSTLSAALSLTNKLVDGCLMRLNSVSSTTGHIESLEDLPQYMGPLLQHVLNHFYNIPIPIVISNIDLLSEYLNLLSNIFITLLPLLLHNVHQSILLHNLQLCFTVFDSFHHLSIQHPHYSILPLVVNSLYALYSFEPKTIPTIEVTSHDVLHHVTQHHIAPAYYSYLTSALLNGTPAAANQWSQILTYQQQQQSSAAATAHPTFAVQSQTPQLFQTATLQPDQHSILGVTSYLHIHTVDHLIPSNVVSFFTTLSQQRQVEHQFTAQQHQNAQVAQNNAAQAILASLHQTGNDLDLPLANTALSSTLLPYPLSTSTITQQAINTNRKLIEEVQRQCPSLRSSFYNVLSTVVFDGSDNAGPSVLKFIPFLIHFYPSLWEQFVRVLVNNVSPQLCSLANVAVSLAQMRIEQQAAVIQAWASAVVRQKKPEQTMTVVSFPVTSTAAPSSLTSISSENNQGVSGGTTFDIGDLMEASTSHVLQYLTRTLVGLVNKPSF